MRVRVVAGLVVLALTAVGCESGGGETPDAGRESSAPTTSSTSPSPTEESGPASPSPSEATPSVEPATGPLMEVQVASIRVPKGFKLGYDTSVVDTAAGPPCVVALAVIHGDPMPLKRLMKRDIDTSLHGGGVKRLPDRTLDDNPAYHYTAEHGPYVRESVGAWDDGYLVAVQFDCKPRVPKARRRAIIESVLATYTSA